MTTFVPNSVILYVSDVEASTTFYSQILGHEPIKTYPGFTRLRIVRRRHSRPAGSRRD